MSKRIVILGGGVIGLSVAEACSRRGHQVTLIEQHGEQRGGCSYGNAGMVVPSHFVPMAAPGMVALGLKWMWNPESPFYIKPRLDLDLIRWGLRFVRSASRGHVERCAPILRDMHMASRQAYQEIAARGEAIGLVSKGLLMLCKESHTLDEEAAMAAKAQALGVPAEVLDSAATARLDPGIAMAVAGAVHYPLDCHLSPELFLASQQRCAAQQGTHFMWDTRVTGWVRDAGRLRAVKTSGGEIEADEFVISGGIWSDGMVRDLGLRLPMQAGKGYSVTLPNPVELPALCSILAEARVAVTPMNGSLRFGGTMEMSGTSESISPRRVEGILRAASSYFPSFKRSDFDGLTPWHGLRPCSPDGMPYLGRSSAASNLVVATGHAMMGLSLAPVTAAIVARLLDGEAPGFDLRLLSPERFA
ncbi:MAG: FAD-dependent oxidoreductase [Verrucomicrobia bacterium]|nr:MAG: FAD-dependent oxidoreductase [Verrucomicrobiota bacterium]